jgi:5-formyltetrahydrofolate cyclo-ligase
MSEKKKIRKEKRAERDAIAREAVLEMSERITARVLEAPCYKNAKNILTYVSTGSEVCTQRLIEAALAQGKCVFVPKVYGSEMKFIRIFGLDELAEGYYGILEPVKEEPVWEADENNSAKDKAAECENLCIMPGLAFDRSFNRVGYGGGFYDRFLEGKPCVYRMGLCFECQMTEKIEAEDTDVKPDCIVTEKEIIYNG